MNLKFPSGDKTAFKVVHGFTIYPKTTTKLNLDFDVCRSVIEKGDKDPWILKPTVKVFDDQASNTPIFHFVHYP